MKIPVKFVSELDEEQEKELNRIIKESEKPRIRQRAQAILLSSKKYHIDKIAEICEVHRNTVSSWIDQWENSGFNGLQDRPRSGRPSILTESEKQLVIELAKENPRSVLKIIALLIEQTGKRVSDTTIKRLLKAAKFTWKRIRKSVKSKQDFDEFKAASESLSQLRQQHENGEIEIWYFDETGFDLQPSVPYAWQPNGEIICVPSQPSSRLNVLGFLTPDNDFVPFCFEGNINSDVVVACFDAFASLHSDKKRMVVIDNAPIHTSDIFLDCIPDLEEKGVVVKFLPTYSPELNIIEILWRFIKHYWLPFSAYLSLNNLREELELILRQIGSVFKINFAS